MDFLKQLNEEYRLFHITDNSIEEIDIEEILGDEESIDDMDAPVDDESEDSPDLDVPAEDLDDETDLDADDVEMEDLPFDDETDSSEESDDSLDSNLDFSEFDTDETEDNSDYNLDDESIENNYNDDEVEAIVGDEEEPTSGQLALDPDLTGLELTDDEEEFEFDSSDFDDLVDDEEDVEVDFADDEVDAPTDDASVDFDEDDMASLDAAEDGQDALSDEGDSESGDEESLSDEDPNYQGVIRTVKGANLVYKRQNKEGTFDELWIYSIGDDIKAESAIRRAILAGTDINPSSETSDDGDQTCETTSVGNVQFLRINNLPN